MHVVQLRISQIDGAEVDGAMAVKQTVEQTVGLRDRMRIRG